MKKFLAIVLTLIMVFTAISVISASAVETPAITYTDHLDTNKDKGYDYDVTNASIAWVKQANGVLVWVPADDTRSDDAIIAQAKATDNSLNHVNECAVLRGLGTAETPNRNGAQTTITVTDFGRQIIMSIEGKYSHFVGGYTGPTEVEDEPETDPAEPEVPEVPEVKPTEPAVPEGDTGNIRIDVPQKMAVVFADGTVYYGGEMKEVVFGQEYTFQMCSVNWENGTYDQNGNGIAGTVVYRMTVVHQDKFNQLAREAAQDPERYTVKGIDIIDNVAKTIIVNGDAEDTHLETDVNNFFMAYRFHFETENVTKATGIDGVINTPVQSLSVNLPLGSTIACKAYVADEVAATENVFVANNSGEGVYDNVFLTSVNDYTWAL